MIDIDLLLFAILVLLMLIFLYRTRRKLELQKIAFPLLYFVLYKTKLGIKSMQKLADKFPRVLNIIGYVSIIIGFLGMGFILFFLLKGAFDFLFLSQPSPVGLVLPRVEIAPGFPTLSFMHWIVAIIILATVHEFSHGVFAKLNKIRVKSSGFAFLGILVPIVPAAFVEPDEKAMAKASKKAQLEVLSAGSFANFITAFIALAVSFFLIVPLTGNILVEEGIHIVQLEENGPAETAGVKINESITSINGVAIGNLEEFKSEMDKYSPFEKVTIQTNKDSYQVTLAESPNEKGRAHLGVFLIPEERVYNPELVNKYGEFPLQIFSWIGILFTWLFIINLGVGMFNLLPLGILDGGKMFYIGILHITKNNEILTKTIWKYTNIILIAVLLLLILPQIYKTLIMPLLSFII